ncbi:MAG TPA: isoamylase [Steroidobacter sp.]|uniref:glycogen debranching protein n=1 Tax=Steroidobacter sp. TaxID=1978227 RepID=UPI002ED9439C
MSSAISTTAEILTGTGHDYSIQAGTHAPPGATHDGAGVNFSIFARDATEAELRLYARADSAEPFQVVHLTPEAHRTFSFWHVYIDELPVGTHYTWRIATADRGLDQAPELLDPWARATSDALWDRRAAIASPTVGNSFRAIVCDRIDEPTTPLAPRDIADNVIYEMHVGGFTRHASAGVRHPGTFEAVTEKIPYLKQLGVTHVEFLPVMAFDEDSVPDETFARGLRNYWGYNTYGFYAPHPGYCVSSAHASHEFLACVEALHAAGIGVLLDVVFNHTAEAGADGPTINFKALANDVFYQHEANDPRRHRDYTGCGNTLNCNHPLVANFILHCLEYWTEQLGVDGFRFDLASVFARGPDGAPLADPPLTWAIELSPSLTRKPVIAEAWDAVGLYQVGAFPGMRWAEWNGRYRDVMRSFVRGEPGMVGEVATRLCGSPDMYGRRSPLHSVNFITCHDGFTLRDLVSYNDKHNEANGDGNRDGCNQNLSWNCGYEGPTDDPEILALRSRQARNLMAILLLSQGTPMILAGDEVLHTQRGNNNAYCQDNEISWFDWRRVESEYSMLRFTRELIALRRRHRSLRRKTFLRGRPAQGAVLPDIVWHGERLDEPPWFDPNARQLAFTLAGVDPEEPTLHVILNMGWERRTFRLPVLPRGEWRCAVNTALAAPNDIAPPGQQEIISSDRYDAAARSVVVLEHIATH